MPTGYTAAIKDGITFEQFTMSCARAFGALVMMRDEPANAPIPERLEPSDYHAKRLTEAQAALDRYEHIAASEAAREAAKEYADAVRSHQECIADKDELRNKYNAMLARVVQWEPPTPKHQGLKEFMLKQIRESIDFDCSTHYYTEPKQLSVDEWRVGKIAQAKKDIAYHTKAHAEEVERTESRNAWLSALRASLAKTAGEAQ